LFLKFETLSLGFIYFESAGGSEVEIPMKGPIMEKESGKSWMIPVVIISVIIASGFLFYLNKIKSPEELSKDASTTNRKQELIKWYPYEEGLALGKAQGKKVFLFFWTEWCVYCKKMDKETFSKSPVIVYLNDHFISIKVNSDKARKTAIQYAISGVPTSWFLAENGGKISNLPGYVPADMFLPVLKFIHTDSYKTMTFGKYLNSM
jgi:thioredoxin-related protein